MKTVTILTIDSEQSGQRIDNFLIGRLKGLPKARLYRAIRKGEVRVNKKRVKPIYRLRESDQIRIPPFQVDLSPEQFIPDSKLIKFLESRILYEDNNLLVINKPAGLPVHGGSRVSIGLIEILKAIRPNVKSLELVHRLDQDTSGCLLIAKKRSVLVELHRLLTGRLVKKQYLALVKGAWKEGQRKVDAPLLKNCLSTGERIVKVNPEGKAAVTLFRPLRRFKDATLVQAFPVSGRTHQIRVHAAYIGYPIAGDEKYGCETFNQKMRKLGLKRLFLHAASISCQMAEPEFELAICALLDDDLRHVLESLEKKDLR